MLVIPKKSMPNCCYACPCERESTCGACESDFDPCRNPAVERMPWCPLIDISDVGNVIDWLNEIISNPEWQRFYSKSETRINAENALKLIKQIRS